MTEKTRHVLVVDDSAAIRCILKHNLEAGGYTVTQATNGREACDIASVTTFDLVICDYQMPLMDGAECCRELRRDSRYAQTPIIVLTGKHFESEQMLQWQEINVTELAGKPFSPRDVVQKVNKLLK